MKLVAQYSKYRYEAGIDEAGRGCLAGPVVAAAVILPEAIDLPGLNDSKKLGKSQKGRTSTANHRPGSGMESRNGPCTPHRSNQYPQCYL